MHEQQIKIYKIHFSHIFFYKKLKINVIFSPQQLKAVRIQSKKGSNSFSVLEDKKTFATLGGMQYTLVDTDR